MRPSRIVSLKCKKTQIHQTQNLKNYQTKKQQHHEYELRKEKEETMLNKEDIIIYDGKLILRLRNPNYDPSKQRQYVDSRTKDTNESQPTA